MIKSVKNKILAGKQITTEEVAELLKIQDKQIVYNLANEIKKHFIGNNVEFCSIVNAKSGSCSEDCKWCSQSAHYKTLIEKYSFINSHQAVNAAMQSTKQGINRFSLVTSGRTLKTNELEQALSIYKKIQNKTNINLCASMGLLNKLQLLQLKENGVTRYHCNLETAPSFFTKLCSTHTIAEKLETIRYAQEIGMEICSGGIIGMGETMEQRIELAFLLSDIKADSIPINILNPIKGTPLQDTKAISDEDVLITIALFRIINPQSRIRIAGGRERFNKKMQGMMLNAGACSLLVGDYLTTIGNKVNDDKQVVANEGLSLYKNYKNDTKSITVR